MIQSTVLSAINRKRYGTIRLKPKVRVATRECIGLDAKCRNKKAVNHIPRGQSQANRLPFGDHKDPRAALAVGIGKLPHPLLCCDMDLIGVPRGARSEERRVGTEWRSRGA